MVHQHMCCQNCYGLLQRMTALERDFRSVLSDFKDWHFSAVRGAVRGETSCGSMGSRQREERLTVQRTVETHRTGPEEGLVGYTAVSTADRDGKWVEIGAKPKRRALYSSVVSSSTPGTHRSTRPTTAAQSLQNKARTEHRSFSLQLRNRYEPLHALGENQESSEHSTDSVTRVNRSQHPKKHTADTLVIGDDAVNGVSNPKLVVRCEPNMTVPELNEKLPSVLAEYKTVKRVIVHVGKNDTSKQESEVLKRDFNALFNTLSKLNVQSFISGPLPAGRTNMFSRLLGLNTWLHKSCRSNGLNFIDNFNLFFGKRELFRRDGLHINKRGVKCLTENLLFSVCNLWSNHDGGTPAPTPRNSEPAHRPPTEDDSGELQTLDVTGSDHGYQLPETPDLHEESSTSSISTSPSPHLILPAAIEKLVSAGTRLSLSLSASPQVQRRSTQVSTPPPSCSITSSLQTPRLSPQPSTSGSPHKKRQAPQPPGRQLRSRLLQQQEIRWR